MSRPAASTSRSCASVSVTRPFARWRLPVRSADGRMSVRSNGFTRRHGGAEAHGVLNHAPRLRSGHPERSSKGEGHEAHEERPFDGPPQAACCDVRERKYKPLSANTGRLVFVFSYVAAAGVLRTPANRTAASVRLRLSVPPCETVTSVTSVASQRMHVFQHLLEVTRDVPL